MKRELQNRSVDFRFDELGIIPADLETMMRFEAGEAPEPFPALIEEALNEAPRLFFPTAGCVIRDDISFNQETREFSSGGHTFSPGKIIFSQIRKAESLLFFIATAGEAVSDRCHQLNKSGDIIYSYILDTLGSIVAEKAVEKLTAEIETELDPLKLRLSESYSPGYCNWDVAQQQMLFSFFPKGFCGVTLSPSSLMHPVKSISGIIGIGTGLSRKGYFCDTCNDQNCIYRRVRSKTS